MNAGRLNAKDFGLLGVALMAIHFAVRAFDQAVELAAHFPGGWSSQQFADELAGVVLFGAVAWALFGRSEVIALRLVDRDEDSAALALARLLTVGFALAGAILVASRIGLAVYQLGATIVTPPGSGRSFDDRFFGDVIRLAGQVVIAGAGLLLFAKCRSAAERFLRVAVAWESDDA